MAIVLLEGQPGSGKTTYANMILDHFQKKKLLLQLVDEDTQDKKVFFDYWAEKEITIEVTVDRLVKSWRDYINALQYDNRTHLIENSLMNQVQFLLACNGTEALLRDYFAALVSILATQRAGMVFLEGDATVVISRVAKQRQNGWSDRVSDLLERCPYQQTRNRKGFSGMVEFFKDAQQRKMDLLRRWPYPMLRCDVTDGHYGRHLDDILEFVKGFGRA